MFILISPAKTMKEECIHKPTQLPAFLHKTKSIVNRLKTYDCEQLMKLMKINSKIADITLQRIHLISYDLEGYSALDCYDGIQFKAMKLDTCSEETLKYMEDHLRIVSGLYGLLKPSDAIYPYRLEMQTKIEVEDTPHLYAFWMDELANYLIQEREYHNEPYILNLASKEYDKCIRPYIKDKTFIDIEFYEKTETKLKMHSTQVKKARANMVRFLAENKCEHLQEVKMFCDDGYAFCEELSNDTKLVYIKEK